MITLPGLINLDFADVRTIIRGAGTALLGIGYAGGGNRASEAALAAIASPLLETPIDGAKGILLGVTGGPDLSLVEVSEAARVVADAADPDANIIFGATIDPDLAGPGVGHRRRGQLQRRARRPAAAARAPSRRRRARARPPSAAPPAAAARAERVTRFDLPYPATRGAPRPRRSPERDAPRVFDVESVAHARRATRTPPRSSGGRPGRRRSTATTRRTRRSDRRRRRAGRRGRGRSPPQRAGGRRGPRARGRGRRRRLRGGLRGGGRREPAHRARARAASCWCARPRATTALLDFFVAVPGPRPGRPAASTRPTSTRFTVPFGGADQVFHIGPASVAVPGMVAGLGEAMRRFGRLPLADVVAPGRRAWRARAWC